MRVLISGAGVAGPTLAWFLARTGAQVTIVEKSSSILPHGQNIDIKDSSLTIINKMGLMDEIRRFNTTEQGTRFIGPSGQPFAPFPVKEGHMCSPSSEFEILRADLAKVLYNATKDHANIQYLFGTAVSKVISNNDKGVRVELCNGEVHDFGLLVAADGQWSKLRKQCFDADQVKVVPQGMYAVYYTIPRLPSDDNWWNVYVAPQSRIITLRPDPYGTTRAMFTLVPRTKAQAEAWKEAARGGRRAQQELVKLEFAGAGWQAERLLDNMGQADDFYFHVIEQIQMTKWSNSRIVCLGDAAYAPTPLTGMGTSLAIIGAYLLAGELSKLGKGEHPDKALQAYEGIFRPYVEESQKIMPIFPGIAHPEGPLGRRLLNGLVWTISKVVTIPWLANRSVNKDIKGDNFPWPEYEAFDESSTRRTASALPLHTQ
ncbi:hypothetical protein PFICI_09962 [Pestalotiopsis fici W106-1]|uniref:FAD-binding domain-containing protein n=1 Tax=Pestalotiopsis fici (strain W106-1 / CGMCC3.15140) TaxID=1229662 RepID=W3WVM6_PESFW|nr:uncharacterized protein PFICI_09962 [Pestalotiopsis fici W106-1]ETS77900.1 hypothetical protein PFICI_09962 [Pestalotiopsis fici W106-1]